MSKDENKIKGCEGNASLTERIEFKFKYRGEQYHIILVARDLTEDEEAMLNTFRDKLFADHFGKDSKLTYEQKLNQLPTTLWAKHGAYLAALRLGSHEKILNEGWKGIDAGLLRPGEKAKGTEFEVSYENLWGLKQPVRAEIVNRINRAFELVFDDAEAKN